MSDASLSDDMSASSSDDEFSENEAGTSSRTSHLRDEALTRPKGLTGLQNLGNSCYMNAALQALSNCPQLTRYMLDCGPFVRKPGLARSYMRLVKEMWSPKRPSYVTPSGIAHGIKNVCPLFKGYNQHDSQEFLRCFLDTMHEELKEPIVIDSHDSDSGGDAASRSHYSDSHHHPDGMSDAEAASSSDADYETCDSGLSSETSPFGDEMLRDDDYDDDHGHQVRDNEMDMGSTNGETTQTSTTRPVPFINKQRERNSSSVSKQSSSSPSEMMAVDSARSVSPPMSTRTNKSDRSSSISNATTGACKKKSKALVYRSVISDVFDGKLLSSVQCLTCDNVSTTRETFQDLSLPIPSRDQLHMVRAAQSGKDGSGSSSPTSAPNLSSTSSSSPPLSRASSTLSLIQAPANVYSYLWGWVEWMIGWIWGPTVSLQDCLSAFFSADELKGDNMYSCEKCKKLRNGVKYSKVVQLPDILCIHLKRFRHELMYSSKIASQVTFPLEGLDMAPYIASDLEGQVTTYDLNAVICHHGTPASGHYTAYCLNAINETWYEFDDQYVTAVDPHQVAYCEAYVLFYRKASDESIKCRQKAMDLMKLSRNEPSLLQFFISKQWINRFNTFAEPGPISNHDFLCEHGSVDPDKASFAYELSIVVSRSVWEYLYSNFGGGPVCTKLFVCRTCSLEKEQLDRRRKFEYDNFQRLNALFTNQRSPSSVFSISMSWFNLWEAFITRKSDEPPGPIDNMTISTTHPRTGQIMVKVGSDHATISGDMWQFFHEIYGGGPTVGQINRNRSNTNSPNDKQQQQQHNQQHHSQCGHSSSSSHSHYQGDHTQPPYFGQGGDRHYSDSMERTTRPTPTQRETPKVSTTSPTSNHTESTIVEQSEPMEEDPVAEESLRPDYEASQSGRASDQDDEDDEANADALCL